MSEALVVSAAAVFIYMTAVFLLALRLKDNSIADIAWGARRLRVRYGRTKLALMVLAQSILLAGSVSAQFRDDFNGPLKKNPDGIKGWAFFTGEGKVVMDLRQGDGYASILVDATRDRRNVWWALIKHRVSDPLDLSRLKDPAFALRVEARIRASEAPRRVNLHLNTQKTVNFHTHL